MAILNFPDNPQLNDQYTGDNGTTYIFDGIKWIGHSVAQPAGTNSITNNGHTLQIDGDGNVIIPNGSHIYYQNGTALSGAQGPQGVKGDTGDTGTIDIGITTTGVAGSSAEVYNVGTSTAAIFNFTIPRGDKGDRGSAGANGLNGVGDKGDRGDKGDKGDQGVSVTLQGTKATIADLPAAPVNPNDYAGHGWIVTTGDGGTHLDGSLWFWNIADQVWNDIGQIQGPQGLKGDRGDRGLTGNAGANGLDGAGVATGGSTGQILSKVSGNDFDTHWVTNDRLTAGAYTVRLDGPTGKLYIPGYLLTPWGGLRTNTIDEGLSLDSFGSSSLVLTSNGNLNKWIFGVNGTLTLPHVTDTPYDSTIGATYNINLNANGSFTKFASDGYMEIPGDILAQQGNDLNLKVFNPTVDGVPGGTTLSLQNRDVDSGHKTTQFNLGASDVVLTTDFAGAKNEWTFAHDGSLTVPTNGRVNFGQPTLRTPSWGAKNELITLYDFDTPGTTNYGIGVSDHTIWMSTDSTTAGFAWYGGEGAVALELGGDGTITTHNTIKSANGNANLTLNSTVYLSPNTDDFTALYMNPTDVELYSQGALNFAVTQARTSVYGTNISTSGDNVLVFDTTNDPTITQIAGGWTLFFNLTNYYVQGVQNNTPSAGQVTITVTGPVSVGQGSVEFRSPPSYNNWNFAQDGSIHLPNSTAQKDSANVQCNVGMDTVIYTGSVSMHTFKLLIKVEGYELTSSQPWETQSTEMIIANSFSGRVAASAYGVVHTSVDPLATFTARWNATISRVEVLCRPTSTTYPVYVKTFATEILTSD